MKMLKRSVTIELDERVVSRLQRRAKRNMLSLRELIEDIIRRSAVSSGGASISGDSDDALVSIFSRKTKARKKWR